MNTDCSKCIFLKDKKCEFDIPNLIEKDYEISTKDGNIYIKDYKCSYAFSKVQYQKNKKELPDDMIKVVQHLNRLDYYLIIDCTKNDIDIIKNKLQDIANLHTVPTKLSMITDFPKKTEIKDLISFMSDKCADTIDWKIHNLTSDQEDYDKLFDILNVNVINGVTNIWYLHLSSCKDMEMDLNYLNFLSKVLKPKYPAIRKNDKSLDGLFISRNNLRLIKNEHESGYVKFLQHNNTLVRKYYE